MLQWVNTHGFVVIAIWGGLLLVAGTVPPLGPDAGFWAKWAYAILKGFSLNSRGISNALGIKLPELRLEKSTNPTTAGEGQDVKTTIIDLTTGTGDGSKP